MSSSLPYEVVTIIFLFLDNGETEENGPQNHYFRKLESDTSLERYKARMGG